jgi:hypothetical protein
MKKALTWALATLLAFTISSTLAVAHAGQDECEHGNSGQECKPDPNPNGEDCEEHGQSEGNEDHCLPIPTTTTYSEPPPTTSTTTVPPDPTTTTEVPTTVVTTTAPPTSSPPPSTSVTSSTAPPPGGETSQPPKDESNNSPRHTTGGSRKDTPPRLAFTGVEDVVPAVAVVLLLAVLGSWLLWMGRRRDVA